MVTCHFSSKERTKVVIVNRAFVRGKSESFGNVTLGREKKENLVQAE